MHRRALLALAALAGVVVVTTAWWLLALWPSDPTIPAWVERARAVCFGVAEDGMPHAGGWLLLVGEPLGMLGFLLAAWGDEVREGLRALARSHVGRGVLVTTTALLCAGVGAATLRVRTLSAQSADVRFDPAAGAAGAPVKVDRPAPPLALVDHRGDTARLAQYHGRVVLVAFAYGHCQTVCPLVVHDAMRAVAAARDVDPALLVVTLDPWRDTPGRLPHIAAAWGLDGVGRLLGGGVTDVERTLDAWGVARRRDGNTGEIVHPTSVHVVGRDGRLAWVVPGDAARLAAVIRGL